MARGLSWLSTLICKTPLQYLPVRVRGGLADGTRWTFLPVSTHWRHGGEPEIAAALALLDGIAGASCWDFGAHFGIHTVGLAMHVGPAGHVAAFEPDQVAFDRLARHVRMNRLVNVSLFNLAASNRVGRSDLIIVAGLGSMRSYLPNAGAPVAAGTPSVQVETIAADLLVERGELRLPDFIKVDVQGHGAEALEGARASLERKRPLILFSNHSAREAAETRRLLVPLGYRPYDTRGNRRAWETLNDPGGATAVLAVRA